HFVIDSLRGWDCDEELLDEASLVMTELASNAVRHAGSAFSVRLQVWPRERLVRLSVRDAEPTEFVANGSSPSTADSGRGLGIVAGLARRWGVDVIDHGKVVWAELSFSRR